MPRAQSLVARFLIKLSLADSNLNYNANALELIPASALNSMFDAFGSEGELMSVSDKLKAFRTMVRPKATVPTAEEAFTAISIAREPSYTMDRDMLDLLGKLTLMTSGTSEQMLGFSLGAGESGAAREKMQDPAAARSQGWRTDVQLGTKSLLGALGLPTEGLSISYASSAYENRTARHEQIREDVQARIITPAFGARLLGYDEQMNETERAEATREMENRLNPTPAEGDDDDSN